MKTLDEINQIFQQSTAPKAAPQEAQTAPDTHPLTIEVDNTVTVQREAVTDTEMETLLDQQKKAHGTTVASVGYDESGTRFTLLTPTLREAWRLLQERGSVEEGDTITHDGQTFRVDENRCLKRVTPLPTPDADTAPSDAPEASDSAEASKPTFSAEALASSKTVTLPNRGGEATGLQFIPTPPEAAQLVAQVLGQSFHVFDPTAGDGALLAPYLPYQRIGAEIDPDLIAAAKAQDRPYKAVQGDLQALYPLFRLSPVRFYRIVLNPPFGLQWQQGSVNDGKAASSTKISFEMALGLLANGGQGALICGTRRLDDEILTVPALAKAVYAVLDCGKMFPGVDLDCSIVFFADPQFRRVDCDPLRMAPAWPAPEPRQIAVTIRQESSRVFPYLPAYSSEDETQITSALRDIQAEARRRVKQAERTEGYDLELSGDKLRVYLSPLATDGLSRAENRYHGTGYQTLKAVKALHGQQAAYFAMHGREWKWLARILADGLLTMHPDDLTRLQSIVTEGRRAACPLYPLKPQQRLGYIEDLDALPCTQSDPAKGFEAGQSYAVTVGSEIVTREREEVKIDEEGTAHTHKFVSERKILRVILTSGIGPVTLKENKSDLEYLLAHFDVPDPGDVATHFPAEMEQARETLRTIETSILGPQGEKSEKGQSYALKNYQREDVSRLLVKNGGVLAWEQGLGKTIGAMTFAEAVFMRGETDGNALFITPQDLIPQWQREARKFYGREMIHITSQAQARQIAREIRTGQREAAWYVTHYEALALTGTTGSVTLKGGDLRKTQQGRIALPVRAVTTRTVPKTIPGRWEGDTYVPEHQIFVKRTVTTKDLCPACWNVSVKTDTNMGWDGYHCDRCGYTHAALKLPSIGHELRAAFRRGCVVVDEGTKIKGDSLQSLAVRGLSARRKLLLTGTPQKNYVNDMFWLLGWACGFGTPRFPFAYTGGKEKFEKDFCVIEYRQNGRRKENRKILPEVTNLSVLWRLLSGAIVRRRKEQTGEALVPITFVPVTVPMGEAQKALYAKWLYGIETWYRDAHPDAKGDTKFAALLRLQSKLNWTTTLPTGDEHSGYWRVPGVSDDTPKDLKVKELAAFHAARGEKVLIGSDCMLLGKRVANALNQKGIPAAHILEGEGEQTKTKSPAKRAAAIHSFAEGDTRVLCAGVQSINLGHNLDAASVVILAGLPWDYATLHQFMARAHRLTSTRPVTVYVVLTAGSLDERKWEMLNQKQNSADLALDGELSDRVQEEVSMTQIMADLIARGLPADEERQTAKEADCRDLWEAQTFELAPLLGPLKAGEADTLPAYNAEAETVTEAAETVTEPTPEPVKKNEEQPPTPPSGHSWIEEFTLTLVRETTRPAKTPRFTQSAMALHLPVESGLFAQSATG